MIYSAIHLGRFSKPIFFNALVAVAIVLLLVKLYSAGGAIIWTKPSWMYSVHCKYWIENTKSPSIQIISTEQWVDIDYVSIGQTNCRLFNMLTLLPKCNYEPFLSNKTGRFFIPFHTIAINKYKYGFHEILVKIQYC